MKKFLIVAWIIFLAGVILKLLHIPGANILSILGTMLILLHSLIFASKNFKSNLTDSLFYVSVSSITLYVLIRIMFWPAGIKILGFYILFLLPLFLNFIYFTRLKEGNLWTKVPNILFVIYFVFFVQLSFIHSYKIYYFFNLSSIINNHPPEYLPAVWDNYSWFLNLADKKQEALDANQKAIELAQKLQSNVEHTSDMEATLIRLNEHKQQIENGSWKNYSNKD